MVGSMRCRAVVSALAMAAAACGSPTEPATPDPTTTEGDSAFTTGSGGGPPGTTTPMNPGTSTTTARDDTTTTSGPGGVTVIDESGGAEDSGVGMDDDMPLVTSIPDIKQGFVPAGTWVQLSGVAMTTDWAPASHGAVNEGFIQDLGGGPYSGILVRLSGASTDELSGDEVVVVGLVRQELGHRWILANDTHVIAKGAAPPIDPVILDVTTLAPFHPNFWAYEGMVVRLDDLIVTGQELGGEPILNDRVFISWQFYPGMVPLDPGAAVISVTGVQRLDPEQGLAIAPRQVDELSL